MSERTIVDRYEVLSELGTGGMGTVFLAHDTKLKRHVAVKALNEDTASDDNKGRTFVTLMGPQINDRVIKRYRELGTSKVSLQVGSQTFTNNVE